MVCFVNKSFRTILEEVVGDYMDISVLGFRLFIDMGREFPMIQDNYVSKIRHGSRLYNFSFNKL